MGDISKPFPFKSSAFYAVYSHLSLHYFDCRTTRAVFAEIHRVLQSGGLLAFTVKSIHDHRYGQGKKLEENMYDYNGHVRRFFSLEDVPQLLENFQMLSLEEYEEQYDRATYLSSFIKVIASAS